MNVKQQHPYNYELKHYRNPQDKIEALPMQRHRPGAVRAAPGRGAGAPALSGLQEHVPGAGCPGRPAGVLPRGAGGSAAARHQLRHFCSERSQRREAQVGRKCIEK